MFPVLVLGAVSALVYAAAAVAQRGAAERAALPGGPGYRRSGVWWAAVLLNALGALLHTAALRDGSLVAVQMLGVLTLAAAPLMSAAVLRRPMSGAQWRGTALTVAGVAGLLVLTRSTGSGRAPEPVQLLGAVLLTAGTLGVTTLAAIAARRTTARSLWYAAAAGVAFAAASALAQAAVRELAGDGGGTPLSALLTLAGVACLAPTGLALCQLGYRGGLEAPLATVTLVNPLFAAVIGAVLGDRYPVDPGTALAGLVAALAAGRGVLDLARAEGRERDREEERERDRDREREREGRGAEARTAGSREAEAHEDEGWETAGRGADGWEAAGHAAAGQADQRWAEGGGGEAGARRSHGVLRRARGGGRRRGNSGAGGALPRADSGAAGAVPRQYGGPRAREAPGAEDASRPTGAPRGG
ncbi:hypothetical protein [Streptomyces sp. NPDC014995]|uniref:hypothetical protein n=1 Tax=Streptomyces sp. NPDC014995 TaxID=3364936 RepID=UPI0036F9F0E5